MDHKDHPYHTLKQNVPDFEIFFRYTSTLSLYLCQNSRGTRYMTFDVFLIMRYIGTSTRILSEKLVFQVQSTAILIETAITIEIYLL